MPKPNNSLSSLASCVPQQDTSSINTGYITDTNTSYNDYLTCGQLTSGSVSNVGSSIITNNIESAGSVLNQTGTYYSPYNQTQPLTHTYYPYISIKSPKTGDINIDLVEMIFKIYDGIIWHEYNIDDFKIVTLENGTKQIISKLSKNITVKSHNELLKSRKVLVEKFVKIKSKSKWYILIDAINNMQTIGTINMPYIPVNIPCTIPYTPLTYQTIAPNHYTYHPDSTIIGGYNTCGTSGSINITNGMI